MRTRALLSTGLDRLLEEGDLLRRMRSERIGVLCHHASVTRNLTPLARALAGANVEPRVLFGPEHGIEGHAQDMVPLSDDAGNGAGERIRVRSLYGENESDLSPRAEDLADLDRVVIDLQDVGSRYYTFVWSAVLMLRACARTTKCSVLVLDRPNPLGPAVEGKLIADPHCRSFVGLEPTPIRHGLTLGQIVAWRALVEGIPKERLTVLGARGLSEDADASTWDRPMVAPSPNMPNLETAWVYPGACLLEGTNLSEGRGTTRPFLLWGAPWLDAERVIDAAGDLDLRGVRLRPHVFEPMFQKFAGQRVRGIEVHVTDREAFEPVRAYAGLIAIAAALHPEHFQFRTERYEYRSDVPAIDLLTGSSAFREHVLGGTRPRDIAATLAEVGEPERQMVSHARESTTHFFA